MAAKKRKRKPKTRPADEGALKAGYLEMYAARDANQRLSRLRSKMGILISTLDRWMQDEAFCGQVAGIDQRRLKAAEGLATTIWPEIVERQAEIATGVLPDPPPGPPADAEDYGYQVRVRLAGHQAACAAAIKMSTRAAEFIGKFLHQLQEAQLVYGADAEVFGRLSDLKTPEELAEEVLRRKKLLDDWRERLATRKKA